MGKSLLIIGAGGHGKVVAEVAAACGYENISFLDDNSTEAIGKINELVGFRNQFGTAFVGIGNNQFRDELIKKLTELGFRLPVLIHPTAYVSKTATIAEGTVVEPMATVNTNAVIGKGCIVSVGAIVDHDSVLETCVHVNAGAIVKAGAHVEENRKLEAGEVVLGF